MPEPVGFRCRICHHGFVAEVLTEAEMEERRRRQEPWGRLTCPRCGREQVERA